MKKFVISVFIVILLLTICLPLICFAAQNGGLPYYVSDVAGLLAEEDRKSLETDAKRISETYSCGVYVVTLDDYRRYLNTSESSFLSFSESFYTDYSLGIGPSRDGILLILSMEDSDYSLIAYGDLANRSFTDYGKSVLERQFLPLLSSRNWYRAFSTYISGCEELLRAAAEGAPVDVPASSYSASEMPSRAGGLEILITILAPSGIAFSVCQGMKRKMKQVREKRTAEDYILPGGVDLRLRQDVFVNRTVTRTPLPKQDKGPASSGTGGGTTVRPSGFSGHSGKF